MRFILFITLSVTFLFSDESMVVNIKDTLQKIIEATREKKKDDIQISYDPFHSQKSKPIVKKENLKDKKVKHSKLSKDKIMPTKLSLSMILNKNAFINGKWYKVNQKVADYRIVKINEDIVVLKKNRKYTTLKLISSNKFLITKEDI